MFKRPKKGAPPLDPEFLRGFHERAKTEGPRLDALVERISGSARELGRLADIAADSSKSEDERHEALVLISGAVSRHRADISNIGERLRTVLGDESDLLSSSASSVLAAHYLERRDFSGLIGLASDKRNQIRLAAVREAEIFVLSRGYDSGIATVFVANVLDPDPRIRESCRSGLSEGVKAGDEWAGRYLDAAIERARRGRLDS